MPFQFDEDGFLTNRRSLLEAEIRSPAASLFARAHRINRDCHHLLFAAEYHDDREVLVAATFMRALEHYQATVLLLGSGMIAPARAALRNTLEAVFTVRAIAKDAEVLQAFIEDDLLQRRKLINKAKRYEHPDLQEIRGAITQELVESVNAQINESNAKELRTERLARLAGMHEWYTTLYALLSNTTHTHVRDLERDLIRDDARTIRRVEYAPSLDEVPQLLLHAMHFIMLGAEVFAQTFGLPFEVQSEHITFIQDEGASRRA